MSKYDPCSRVQRVVNKGITDINDIRIRPGAKKLFIKNNNITSIESFSIPDHIRNFTFRENNTEIVNGLVLGRNLRKLMLFDTGIKSITNIQWNENIDYVEFSFNDLHSLNGLDLSATGLRRFDAIENNIETLNGLILNDSLETVLFLRNRLSSVDDYSFPAHLKSLNLGGNLFTVFNGSHLPSQLESLDLLGNSIEPYSEIKKLPPNLKTFLFGDFFVQSQDCTGLVLPDSLLRLVFSVTLKATQEDLKTLALPPNLRELIISRNRITSLDGLEFPPSLRRLDISNNPITRQELRKIRERFRKENPKLKIVSTPRIREPLFENQ